MKYCNFCKIPPKYPIDKYCRVCGNKLVDMPERKCICENIINSWDNYCRQCGKQINVKEVKVGVK